MDTALLLCDRVERWVGACTWYVWTAVGTNILSVILYVVTECPALPTFNSKSPLVYRLPRNKHELHRGNINAVPCQSFILSLFSSFPSALCGSRVWERLLSVLKRCQLHSSAGRPIAVSLIIAVPNNNFPSCCNWTGSFVLFLRQQQLSRTTALQRFPCCCLVDN